MRRKGHRGGEARESSSRAPSLACDQLRIKVRRDQARGMRFMNVPTANIAADAPVLLREREKDIAILVLNRPDVRNSLSEAMLIALSSALGDIAADNTVRAVVLAAKGPAFCAGHDLKELTRRRSDADGGRAYFHHIMTTCRVIGLQQMRRCEHG